MKIRHRVVTAVWVLSSLAMAAEHPGVIRGIVVDEGGVPVAAAQVSVDALDGLPRLAPVRMAETDKSGLLVTVASAQTNADAIAAENSENARPSRIFLPELQLRGTLPIMFVRLVEEASLSGGAVISSHECSQGPEGSISIAAGTSLDLALGELAKSSATSKWQIEDGVVNLLPADAAVPPLLQVRIRRFEWDRTTSVREVVDRLRQMPEVSEEASKLGLKEAPLEGGTSVICIRGDCSKKPKPVPELEMEEGVSVLTVLNRVVQAHSDAVWSYSEYRCDKGTLFSLDVLAE
ncbi:MAG TPA: carboxypeptidase-like regulatory domain-containing protein [Candidatus Dormibacteraeota bacterium]|nr:carboxypeptidase-like regulatory domain-containing protein [Candidatus Dormibacteraeota bacterium]